MKLCHIVADGSPGGGTTHVLALAEDLRALGHEVFLVTQHDSYALSRAGESGIEARGINFSRSRLDLAVPFKLGRIVQELRPDVVHVHGGRAGFFIGLVARRKGFPPVLYTVHGYHFLWKSRFMRYLALVAERKSSRNATMTVFVCAYDKDLADKWNLLPEGGKHAIVYNGIPGEAMPQKSVTQPNVVGFLGRLTFQKDPLLFLEIARILASQGYRAKIIGGGEMEDDVRRSINRYGLNDQVRLLGLLPHREALTAISDVSCMVLTSRWEGLPIAVLEAMYMGVPVVAAHVSGTSEIIENGVSGILIRDRDPRQYVDAILRITRDLDFRRNLMDAGKKVVEERFTQQRVTEEYMRLYNCVTGCSPDGPLQQRLRSGRVRNRM